MSASPVPITESPATSPAASKDLLSRFLAQRCGDEAAAIADRLVDRFGDAGGVLAATVVHSPAVLGVPAEIFDELALMRSFSVELAKDSLLERPSISSFHAAKDYLKTTMQHLEHEEFHILHLDKKNRLIATERMSRGTIDHTAVYPREIVRSALARNAACVILAHNHPSGDTTPSAADKKITTTIRDALSGIGVLLHDHFVVGRRDITSFRAQGLL